MGRTITAPTKDLFMGVDPGWGGAFAFVHRAEFYLLITHTAFFDRTGI